MEFFSRVYELLLRRNLGQIYEVVNISRNMGYLKKILTKPFYILSLNLS